MDRGILYSSHNHSSRNLGFRRPGFCLTIRADREKSISTRLLSNLTELIREKSISIGFLSNLTKLIRDKPVSIGLLSNLTNLIREKSISTGLLSNLTELIREKSISIGLLSHLTELFTARPLFDLMELVRSLLGHLPYLAGFEPTSLKLSRVGGWLSCLLR